MDSDVEVHGDRLLCPGEVDFTKLIQKADSPSELESVPAAPAILNAADAHRLILFVARIIESAPVVVSLDYSDRVKGLEAEILAAFRLSTDETVLADGKAAAAALFGEDLS